MRFYYFSLFSWLFVGVVCLVAIGAFWVVWALVLKRKYSYRVFWVSTAVIFVLPWTEELWIAWQFGQLCRKDAGVFVNKTVEVEGFYDDTTHWWRQLKESSSYKFVESRDNLYGTLWRVERDGEDVRHFKIDKPTARYHYKRLNIHTPVAHQIDRFEDVVVDSQTGEILGRYIDYARGAYWFFISLGRPTINCEETRGKALLIYRDILKPTK